ncbi:MAG TPA: hypothetical protein VGQ33_18005 [Vicinamibacteria bacterium]|nr:hypothetical protein [Vicinamibacteria bacterium]
MTPFRLRAANAALAGALVLSVAASARAADTYHGTITGDAQTVTLTHGLAWIDSKGRVSVGFYKTTPNAAEQARALKDGGAIFGIFDVPNVTVEMDFNPGSTRADLASFSSCHIGFSRLDIGIFDYNAFSKSCGPIEFSGALKAGSVVHGKLKGRAEAFPRKDGGKPVYTWDVDFTATLIAKP